MRPHWIASSALVCLTLGALLCAPGSAAVEEVEPRPEFVTGHWKGVGYQGSGSAWAIELTAESGTANATVSYPSLQCGGTWTFVKGHRHLAWFRETITYGKKACVDGGLIAVTPVASNYLTFSYFLPNGGDLASWSTLRRVDAGVATPPKAPSRPEAPIDAPPRTK